MPSLHTLQLSQVADRRDRVPQVMKIAFWALASWLLVWVVVWLVALAL